MTKQELMAELQDVRYYNTHREMFRKAENTGFKADALQKIGKYADLIRTAPLRLQMVYHKIFTEGKTQADTAKELGISVGYTKSIVGYLPAALCGPERLEVHGRMGTIPRKAAPPLPRHLLYPRRHHTRADDGRQRFQLQIRKKKNHSSKHLFQRTLRAF